MSNFIAAFAVLIGPILFSGCGADHSPDCSKIDMTSPQEGATRATAVTTSSPVTVAWTPNECPLKVQVYSHGMTVPIFPPGDPERLSTSGVTIDLPSDLEPVEQKTWLPGGPVSHWLIIQ